MGQAQAFLLDDQTHPFQGVGSFYLLLAIGEYNIANPEHYPDSFIEENDENPEYKLPRCIVTGKGKKL